MKQLQHLQNAIQHMHNQGITRKQLQNQYHLTQYGAKKFTDLLAHETSKAQNKNSGPGETPTLHHTDYTPRTLPKDLKTESIPVTVNHTEPVRETQAQKQNETNEVKDYLAGLEEMVKSVETPVIEWNQQPTSHGVDLVWHETDTHLGAHVEDRDNGETVFDTETVKKIMHNKRRKFSEYAANQAENGGVDTIHWLLGGDIIEGTGIYGGQAHETDSYINEQIEAAGEELIKTYKLLYSEAEYYDANLQIVCVPGNHGDMRISSASNKASFDDLVYHVLHQAVNMHLNQQEGEDAERVRVKRSDTAVGMTFPLRTHTGYVSHGQHLKRHVGTASGQRDALSIIDEYGADVIFRGHFHMPKVEDVNGTPVVMTNSIKPGGMYEDEIKAFGDPGYAFYTATDEKPVKDVEFYGTMR